MKARMNGRRRPSSRRLCPRFEAVESRLLLTSAPVLSCTDAANNFFQVQGSYSVGTRRVDFFLNNAFIGSYFVHNPAVGGSFGFTTYLSQANPVHLDDPVFARAIDATTQQVSPDSNHIQVELVANVPTPDFTGVVPDGAGFNGALGTVDSNTPPSVTVSWGDTGFSTPDVTLISPNHYSITGSHSYKNEEGTAQVQVAFFLADGCSISWFNFVNVGSPDGVITDSNSPSGVVEGKTWTENDSLPLITFLDQDQAQDDAALVTHSAEVDWGDNSILAASVRNNGDGTFSVVGASHTYAEEGTYFVTVRFRDHGLIEAAQTFQVSVMDAPLTAGNATLTLTSTSGGPLTTEGFGTASLSATFTDADPKSIPWDFTGSINWGGLGATTFGPQDITFVSPNPTGGNTFRVTVSLPTQFIDENPFGYSASVTVFDSEGTPANTGSGRSSTTIFSPAKPVADAPISVTLTGSALVEGKPSVIATFTDGAQDESVSDYDVMVSLVDPSKNNKPVPFRDLVVSGSGGNFSISITPSEEAPATLAVTVRELDGSSHDTASGNVTVEDAPLQQLSGPTDITVPEQVLPGFVVTTFRDTGGPEPNSNDPGSIAEHYTATVNAGQGDLAATVVYDQVNDVFSVISPTLVLDEGVADLTVKVSHESATPLGPLTARLTVTEAPLQLLTGPGNFTLEEGQSAGGIVATFIDSGVPEPNIANGGSIADHYSADVVLNGVPQANISITYDSVTQIFSVHMPSFLPEEGSQQTLSVTIHHENAPALIASGSFTVTDAPASASPLTLNMNEGESFNGSIGTFTDPGDDPASEYSVGLIDWGDGSSTSAQVSRVSPGTFSVSPITSHTYAEEGSYPVSVTVFDTDGRPSISPNDPRVTIQSTARVHEGTASVTAASPSTLVNLIEGTPFTFGLFNDPDPNSASNSGFELSNHTALITFLGSSLPSLTATLTPTGVAGQFAITGTVPEEGSFTGILVTVGSVFGDAVSDTIAAAGSVADAPLTHPSGGLTISGLICPPSPFHFDGVVASFDDTNPLATAADFTGKGSITITWPDGQVDAVAAADIAAQQFADHVHFTVTGHHDFTAATSLPVQVAITDEGGQTTSAQTPTDIVLGIDRVDVTVVASPVPVVEGQNLTYTIDVRSVGTCDVDGLVIFDDLPAGVSLQSAPGWKVLPSGRLEYDAPGPLAPGQALPTLTIVVKALDETTGKPPLENVVTVANAAGTLVSNSPQGSANTFLTDTPVADAPITLTVTGSNLIEGQPGEIATFTDAASDEAASDYVAQVTIGGVSYNATIAGSQGAFQVFVTPHEEFLSGVAAVVSVAELDGNASASDSRTVIVQDAPLTLLSGPTSTTIQEGQPLGGVVATFRDTGGAEPDSFESGSPIKHYTATVNVGGEDQPATISYDANTDIFSVISPTIRLDEGESFTLTVKINHEGIPALTATSTIKVTDPAVVLGRAIPVAATEGAAFTSMPLLTFIDPAGTEPNDFDDKEGPLGHHYHVMSIDWGDSTGLDLSSGAVSLINGALAVTGSHTYHEEGSYTIKAIVDHEGVKSTFASGAIVSDPGLTQVSGVTLNTTEYDPTSNVVVATFTDPGGGEATEPAGLHYAATINWGDPTSTDNTSSGTVQLIQGTTNHFQVVGSHTYMSFGTTAAGNARTITVTISHEESSPNPVVATSTANVFVGTTALTVVNAADSGPRSLRDAIGNLDAGPLVLDPRINGMPSIKFGITNTTIFIGPNSLPPITRPVMISAGPDNQPLDSARTVMLDGRLDRDAAPYGLLIDSSGVTVRGLAIGNFSRGVGIAVQEGGQAVIQGDFVGTDAAGMHAAPNLIGIVISSSGNTIGGGHDSPDGILGDSQSNIVSGNVQTGIYIVPDSAQTTPVSGNWVINNLIGPGLVPGGGGISKIGNGQDGVAISNASNNHIGAARILPNQVPGALATDARVGNFISGNGRSGVNIIDTQKTNTKWGNFVQSNDIGTDLNERPGIGNGFFGVVTQDSQGNTIGGTDQDGEDCNVIFRNRLGDVQLLVRNRPSSPGQSGNTVPPQCSGTRNPTPPESRSGPHVIDVHYASAGGVRVVVLDFSERLTPATARNVTNYSVVSLGRDGHGFSPVAIAAANYNVTGRTVVLRTASRLDRFSSYEVTASGTGPNAIAGAGPHHYALDGNNDGKPGGLFVTVLPGQKLRTKVPRGPLAIRAMAIARHARA